MAGGFPGFDFVGIFADLQIGRENYPVGFPSERSHPSFIRRSRSEAVLEMHDLVLGFDQHMDALGELGREIVIDEESHAASCC